jgi:hypothetical protein
VQLVDSGSESSGQWGVHLDGAAALLKAMTRINPSKQPDIRMQLQLCFSLVCSMIFQIVSSTLVFSALDSFSHPRSRTRIFQVQFEAVSLSIFAAFSDLNSSSDIFKLENPCRQILLKRHDTAENV